MSVLICIVIVLLALVDLVLISFFRRRNGEHVPLRPALVMDGGTRLGEVLVLAVIAGGLLAVCVTNPNTGGRMIQLESLPTGTVGTYLFLFAVALAVIGTGLWCVWKSWLSWGVVIVAGTMACYGAYLNLNDHVARPSSFPPQRAEGPKWQVIRLVNSRHEPPLEFIGAELWLNGVYLGTTPVRISTAELLEKVPYWQKEPIPKPEEQGTIPSYESPGRGGEISRSQWFNFRLAIAPFGRSGGEEYRQYFGRAKLGDEWALTDYSSGGSGIPEFSTSVSVCFPETTRHAQQLLKQAVARNYLPGQGWWKELEQYRGLGSALLLEAARHDARLAEMEENHWREEARLPRSPTPDQAWAEFENVLAEADRTKMYDTGGDLGRRVKFLTSFLDPTRLAEMAQGFIPKYGRVAASWERLDQLIQFSTATIESSGDETRYKFPRYGNGSVFGQGRHMPPSGYVVAHAILMMDQILDTNAQPNVIERLVTPDLVRWHYADENILMLACALGGPVLDRFLLRQDWQVKSNLGESDYRENMKSVQGQDVNRWLYLLAHLQDEAGQEFRRKNRDLLWTELGLGTGFEQYSFIDRALGEHSLAMRVWRQSKRELIKNEITPPFHTLMHYLAQMGPYLDPELPVEAMHLAMATPEWTPSQGAAGAMGLPDMFNELRLLPRPKQIACLRRFLKEIELFRKEGVPGDRIHPADLTIIQDALQIRLLKLADEQAMEQWVAHLASADSSAAAKATAGWLRETQPMHPLAERLANDANPRLRLIGIEGLAAWPRPERRVLLSTLAADSDLEVQSKAQGALDEIAKLSAK